MPGTEDKMIIDTRLEKTTLLSILFGLAVAVNVALHEYAHRSLCRLQGIDAYIVWGEISTYCAGTTPNIELLDGALHLVTYGVLCLTAVVYVIMLYKILITEVKP